MLKLVLQRVLAFSVTTVFASALLMVDLDSPSLMSEAQAETCDWELYESCMVMCGQAYYNWQIPECRPGECDGAAYCDAFCRQWSDC
jgi:hypothetical protein